MNTYPAAQVDLGSARVSWLPNQTDCSSANAFLQQCFPTGKIQRVLLVNPPDGESGLFRFGTARRKRYPNYPPYGLAVIAQQLRALKIECKILNLNHEVLKSCHEAASETDFDFDLIWKKLLNSCIQDFEPDLIGVTCMFTMTHRSLKRVCEHAAVSGIPVAIGGVHVTNDVERVLDDISAVSFAFLREADVSVKTFCRVVAGELTIQDLGQVIFNTPEKRIRFLTECRPSAREMDVIPAYDLFDIRNLSQYGVIGNFHGFKPPGTRFATALSNRGCRAQCTFCSVRNFNGAIVRQRSVESVLDELELLRNEYGIAHFVWLDDDLLKDEKRALSLFDGMVQRKLGLTWDATNGVIAAACTDEIVHAMAESGCIALNIGMESGNPDILKKIKKPGNVKHFLTAAERFRRYPQIHARIFLMIGFPGETLRMIQDTINVARTMDLDWCGITPLQPLPNTPIFDAMVEQGLIHQEVGSSEVRFQAGGYGKQDEIDLGIRMASQNFEQAFRAIPLDSVPTREQINDIWFYMNYHLNFHRLFSEDRSIKIQQQLMHLKTLSDVISPEHGFALYFIGYLQNKLYNKIDSEIIDRLAKKIETSSYWRDRFAAFGLAVDDLINCTFENKHIPRFIAGDLPNDPSENSEFYN